MLSKAKKMLQERAIMLAIKNKAPLSRYRDKLEKLTEKYPEGEQRNTTARIFCWAAEIFSEEKEKTALSDFFEQKDITPNLSNKYEHGEEFLSCLARYYTSKGKAMDKAYSDLKKLIDEMDNVHYFCSSNVLYNSSMGFLALCFTDDKKLISLVMNCSMNNPYVSSYYTSLLLEKKQDIKEYLPYSKYKFTNDIILKLLIESREEYGEYIKRYLMKYIDSIFKKNKNTLRTTKELISFLFRSKRTKMIFPFVMNDNFSIVTHLQTILEISVFESIIEYIPKITKIHEQSVRSLIQSPKQLKTLYGYCLGNNIIIYSHRDDYVCRFIDHSSDIDDIDKLMKIYPDKFFYFHYSFLRLYMESIPDLLDFMKKYRFNFAPDLSKVYLDIVELDHSEVTSCAVDIGIITHENFEECIRYAVKKRKKNVIFRLNSEYERITTDILSQCLFPKT